MREKHPNILILYIPPNCTSKLQPQDVVVQKPFKDACTTAFCDWQLSELESAETKGASDGVHTPFLLVACLYNIYVMLSTCCVFIAKFMIRLTYAYLIDGSLCSRGVDQAHGRFPNVHHLIADPKLDLRWVEASCRQCAHGSCRLIRPHRKPIQIFHHTCPVTTNSRPCERHILGDSENVIRVAYLGVPTHEHAAQCHPLIRWNLGFKIVLLGLLVSLIWTRHVLDACCQICLQRCTGIEWPAAPCVSAPPTPATTKIW